MQMLASVFVFVFVCVSELDSSLPDEHGSRNCVKPTAQHAVQSAPAVFADRLR